MIVHQVLSGAGPVDAVTTQALAFRERFEAWGWGGIDVAVDRDPRIGDRVKPIAGLKPGHGDLLLVHYSAYAPRLQAVLDMPNPILLLSHNVTPARWLWDHDAQAAVQCALGRRLLPAFAQRADLVAGVSRFNAAELGSDTVIPILFDPAKLGPATDLEPPGPFTVLFVGRLTPHKRQDAVLRAFAAFRRRHVPEARLVLVGEPLTARYGQALRELADRVAPGAVTIESSLSDAQLAGRFRAAHAFLSLSEHEGFCIPLLEAFHFGVPVVARAAGGVPEVAGDAALLLGEPDGEEVAAEALALLAHDADLRAALRARGRQRLSAYAPDVAAQALRDALTSLASRSAPSAASSGRRSEARV